MSSRPSIMSIEGNDCLIVSFAGMAQCFGGISRFEWVNTLSHLLPDWSKEFYIDQHAFCYHHGIAQLSTNIETTCTYLREKIQKYQKIIFLGVSAGGYAAILFGSLLNVDKVLAFIPPTQLNPSKYEAQYTDLKMHINDVTDYHVYGDLSVTDVNDVHHISHCENIQNFPNVTIHTLDRLNLKKLRDSGELSTIILNISQEPTTRDQILEENLCH